MLRLQNLLGLQDCYVLSLVITSISEVLQHSHCSFFVCLFIERNRRSGRQHLMSTRRMVALYDYDPRESSPNVDVEVPSSSGFSYSLFFCSILCVHHHVDKISQSTTYSLHILSGRYSVCRCVTSKCKESVSHFGIFC